MYKIFYIFLSYSCHVCILSCFFVITFISNSSLDLPCVYLCTNTMKNWINGNEMKLMKNDCDDTNEAPKGNDSSWKAKYSKSVNSATEKEWQKIDTKRKKALRGRQILWKND